MEPTPVDTPYGTLYVDPKELVIGRLLQDNGAIPDISEEVAFFRKYLKPGDTAIDVGANYGLFTLALAQIVGETGMVVALEPNDELHRFWHMTEIHHDMEHVYFLPEAAGRRHENRWVKRDPRGSGGTQMVETPDGSEEQMVVEPLDEMTVGYIDPRPIKAIKIDAEGMDVDVLLGAEKILKEDRPVVIFEWNPEAMKALGKHSYNEFIQLYLLGDDVNYTITYLDGSHPPEQMVGNLAFLPDELLE